LKKTIVVLASAVIALAVFISMRRPATYHVERSIDIQTWAAIVFEQARDQRAWDAWSPWDEHDVAVTIIESRPRSQVKQRVEFKEPFASVADASLGLTPSGPGATHVTWSMDGRINLFGRAFASVTEMDKVRGKDLENGLANLKRLSEANQSALPVYEEHVKQETLHLLGPRDQ
jgi:hypothetical protein